MGENLSKGEMLLSKQCVYVSSASCFGCCNCFTRPFWVGTSVFLPQRLISAGSHWERSEQWKMWKLGVHGHYSSLDLSGLDLPCRATQCLCSEGNSSTDILIQVSLVKHINVSICVQTGIGTEVNVYVNKEWKIMCRKEGMPLMSLFIMLSHDHPLSDSVHLLCPGSPGHPKWPLTHSPKKSAATLPTRSHICI